MLRRLWLWPYPLLERSSVVITRHTSDSRVASYACLYSFRRYWSSLPRFLARINRARSLAARRRNDLPVADSLSVVRRVAFARRRSSSVVVHCCASCSDCVDATAGCRAASLSDAAATPRGRRRASPARNCYVELLAIAPLAAAPTRWPRTLSLEFFSRDPGRAALSVSTRNVLVRTILVHPAHQGFWTVFTS